MNPWVDIAIGNLLRHRPEPEDEPEKECRTCHMQKPLTAFYLRFNKAGKPHYSASCKACICAADRAAAARKQAALPSIDRVLAAIEKKDMTRKELTALLSLSTRVIQRHTATLKADGKIHIGEYRTEPGSSIDAAVFRFGEGKDALAPPSHWHYKDRCLPSRAGEVFSMAGLFQVEQVQGEVK